MNTPNIFKDTSLHAFKELRSINIRVGSRGVAICDQLWLSRVIDGIARVIMSSLARAHLKLRSSTFSDQSPRASACKTEGLAIHFFGWYCDPLMYCSALHLQREERTFGLRRCCASFYTPMSNVKHHSADPQRNVYVSKAECLPHES